MNENPPLCKNHRNKFAKKLDHSASWTDYLFTIRQQLAKSTTSKS
jgi:hypothetical protein